MNITSLLFWLLKKYIYLYLVSIPFVLILVWFWLIYVDRIHLREKSRRYGINISKMFTNNKYFNFYKKYLIYEINAISESIAGFTDGIINKTSVVKIYQTNDANIETINKVYCDINIQTDPIEEPQPKIITNEIIKEVIKEVIIEKPVFINDYNDDIHIEKDQVPDIFGKNISGNIDDSPDIFMTSNSYSSNINNKLQMRINNSDSKRRIRIKRR